MKRYVLIGVLILIMATLAGCSFEYSSDDKVSYDNMNYYTSSMRKICFAADYVWDGSEDSMTINIPDKIGKYRVESLGGAKGRGVPTPFSIVLPDNLQENYAFKGRSDGPYDVPVEELHFTINIGANVKELTSMVFRSYYIYGDYIKDVMGYKIVVSISCSENNKTFYSKDGKLYRRADDSLVDEFFYYDESKSSS